MRTVNRALAVATFRAALLNALDQAAIVVFAGAPTLGRDPGASDVDLPPLFASLDAHVQALAQRFGVDLTDGDEGVIAADALQLPDSDMPKVDLAWMLQEEFDICGDRLGHLGAAQGRAELASMDRVLAWARRAGLDPKAVDGMAGAMPRDDARAEIMAAID